MEIKFKIGSNGKPYVRLKKENKILQINQFTKERFNIKTSSLFLGETKVNSIRKNYERKFVLSVYQEGEGRNEGEFKQSQIHLNEQELIEIRDNIDKVLSVGSLVKEREELINRLDIINHELEL